jgi:flagellar basal body rod protein FlgC
MNALPSFDPPKRHSPSRKSSRARSTQMGTSTIDPNIANAHSTTTTARSPRARSKPTYAHRRQGLEVATKLVTYSTLSIFGMITLVNSIGYHYVQRSKLQHIETEVQDAKIRADKVNTNFTRSFDPHSQASVMQENSYKVAPDRLPVFLVNPETDRSASTERK